MAVLARKPDQQIAAGGNDHGRELPAEGILRIITEEIPLQVDILISLVVELDPVLVVAIIIEIGQGVIRQEFVDDDLRIDWKGNREQSRQQYDDENVESLSHKQTPP